jgi:phage shock protein A
MGQRSRISQLMASDIARLLDRAEDPELAIGQLIGDLEESIVDLRRETVTAVAHQNRLRRQLFAAEEAAGPVEREASIALACGEELRARHVVSRQIGALATRDRLDVELGEAGRVSAELVAALIRMEDRVQLARRKQAQLVRQRRAAGAVPSPRDVVSSIRSRPAKATLGRAFEGYAEAVTALGQEAARPSGDEIEGGGGC